MAFHLIAVWVSRTSFPSTVRSNLSNCRLVETQSRKACRKAGLLTYINGGHEPPVVIGVHGIKATLSPTGPAVGMLPDLDFSTQAIQLEHNDTLFAFTDGVTDAQSETGEFFSKERLMDVLVEPAVSAEAFLKRIVDQIQRHITGVEQYDDLTMLAVRRKKHL